MGVKQPGREADQLLPYSAKVKNHGAIPLLPHVFMMWCFINPEGQLYLYLMWNEQKYKHVIKMLITAGQCSLSGVHLTYMTYKLTPLQVIGCHCNDIFLFIFCEPGTSVTLIW
jgi:hypothetical protein